MNSAERYFKIKDRVAKIALQQGRNPDDILIVAVSKKCSTEAILSVYHAGCRDFGESRIQEVQEKRLLLPQDIRWHFLGTLQKNKVNKAMGCFHLIHAIDSMELAQKVAIASKDNQITTSVLLQVNTSGELSKHGLNEEGWKTHLEAVLMLKNLQVQGLMTMAPFSNDDFIIKKCFQRLKAFKELLTQYKNEHFCVEHLSMGMSHDYEMAIREGATIVRIGTAIFNG